jgi:hypothetical protein
MAGTPDIGEMMGDAISISTILILRAALFASLA